jgi:hypothetical protein
MLLIKSRVELTGYFMMLGPQRRIFSPGEWAESNSPSVCERKHVQPIRLAILRLLLGGHQVLFLN